MNWCNLRFEKRAGISEAPCEEVRRESEERPKRSKPKVAKSLRQIQGPGGATRGGSFQVCQACLLCVLRGLWLCARARRKCRALGELKRNLMAVGLTARHQSMTSLHTALPLRERKTQPGSPELAAQQAPCAICKPNAPIQTGERSPDRNPIDNRWGKKQPASITFYRKSAAPIPGGAGHTEQRRGLIGGKSRLESVSGKASRGGVWRILDTRGLRQRSKLQVAPLSRFEHSSWCGEDKTRMSYSALNTPRQKRHPAATRTSALCARMQPCHTLCFPL
ncbi:hypothetical protein SKAU_G00317140 [Synaphobranchus kaupii]|uniref:Uncharacterized protein n=1 Tax=Synaphobranchus kaupii TaxID=118154 RepID=A0A9Q1EST8_SYNKA|nr:hypothetical protein SKAU_G00317140 [Synaphobranchus kaupii]